MVTGFALSVSKIALDGGVGRVLPMARTSIGNVSRPYEPSGSSAGTHWRTPWPFVPYQ